MVIVDLVPVKVVLVKRMKKKKHAARKMPLESSIPILLPNNCCCPQVVFVMAVAVLGALVECHGREEE